MNLLRLKLQTVISMFILILFVTACSSNLGEETELEDKKLQEGTQVLTLEADGVDEEVFEEIIKQFPHEQSDRIITTSVPVTEMLHILGITPVGVPTSTNPIPKEFNDIDEIGSPMTPDLEVMTHLKPDLVIGAKSLQSSLDESLEGMDMPLVYLPTDSFDDLKVSFKALGTYFEKEEEMNEKMQSILMKENELIERAEGKELPKVLLMIGTSDSFMVMNEKSYLGSLIERLGADNIATSVLNATDTYSPMNLEEIVVANPDHIFVLTSGDHGASEEMIKKEIENNDLWTKLSAYKNGNIHTLEHEVFGVTSIQNVETALTEIANYFFE